MKPSQTICSRHSREKGARSEVKYCDYCLKEEVKKAVSEFKKRTVEFSRNTIVVVCTRYKQGLHEQTVGRIERDLKEELHKVASL